MNEHAGGFGASRPTDPGRQRITLSELLGTATPAAWAGPSSRTVRAHSSAERRTIRMHVPAGHRPPTASRPAAWRLPAAFQLPAALHPPAGLRLPTRPGGSAHSVAPAPLLILRLGLAGASVALIALGVSAAFLPPTAPLNDDPGSPAAVSTRSPELGVPPAPTLVPGSHPYQYPAWVEPDEDLPSDSLGTGNPGPFPEPAVQRAH